MDESDILTSGSFSMVLIFLLLLSNICDGFQLDLGLFFTIIKISCNIFIHLLI